MPNLFLDTEFTELSQSAQLLSLALIDENQYWFYAEFTDVDRTHLSDWHQQHVVPYLHLTKEQIAQLPAEGLYIKGTHSEISTHLKKWLQQWPALTIWADVPAYDRWQDDNN